MKRVREAGFPVVYGDAAHSDTLKAAGIADARSLILGASGIRDPELLIRTAKQLNPEIRVLVRTAYLRESPPLSEAGADRVFAGEGEVALAMTEFVLRELGALPEQIERERHRVRFAPFRAEGAIPALVMPQFVVQASRLPGQPGRPHHKNMKQRHCG